jgi:YD repeat-containing protein
MPQDPRWLSELGTRTLFIEPASPWEIGYIEIASANHTTTTITYTYDPLYRLANASYNDGSYFTYTYDATGNRLTEVTQAGTRTYVYDNANRLKTVVQGTTTYGYTYSGLGDRLRQTINGTPTSYTLDLAAGLTQVLGDGTNTYLYGTSRIGEKQPAGWRYHVGDALGSVRCIVSGE